jgi:hypothetical protein
VLLLLLVLGWGLGAHQAWQHQLLLWRWLWRLVDALQW